MLHIRKNWPPRKNVCSAIVTRNVAEKVGRVFSLVYEHGNLNSEMAVLIA